MLRAITLDYWDTIYIGASIPERVERRQEALVHMLAALGTTVPREEFDALYHESAQVANRWWRDEQRGYHTADRIRWILGKLSIERPADCEHVAHAASVVDKSLIDFPPPLLPGAKAGIEALAARFSLAIVSDTGFASGTAQDQLLRTDGLRDHFVATIYSMDVGLAKPRHEIFQAALDALGVEPAETLHVGDIERTDVRGALAMGMRAVRLDAIRDSGPSTGEFVARSWPELLGYIVE